MHLRQKPNGMWIVDYEVDGARRRVSTGIKSPPTTNPPPTVKAKAREIILGIHAPAIPAATARQGDHRLTMSDLFDRCARTVWHPDNYRSQASLRSNLKLLDATIGAIPAADLTFSRLEQLVADLKARGYKPATIKRLLAAVSRALSMAVRWQELSYTVPMPTVVVNNIKERIISPDEEAAIYAALERRRQSEPHRVWFRFKVLLDVLFATGGRLGECIILGPQHVSEMGGRTYLTFPRYRTKSGKPRTVPLAGEAVASLSSLDGHLLLVDDAWTYFGFGTQLAWRMWDTIRADTGLDLAGVTLHTIRHTTLTRLARGGMDLARLQQWAGHADPKITATRYLHLMPSDLDAGLSILGRHCTSHVIVPSTLTVCKGAETGTSAVQ